MAHWTLRGKHTVASPHLCTLNCLFNTSVCCRPYLGVWIFPVLTKQEGDYWSGLLWHDAKAALDTQSFLVNGLFTLCDHPICLKWAAALPTSVVTTLTSQWTLPASCIPVLSFVRLLRYKLKLFINTCMPAYCDRIHCNIIYLCHTFVVCIRKQVESSKVHLK